MSTTVEAEKMDTDKAADRNTAIDSVAKETFLFDVTLISEKELSALETTNSSINTNKNINNQLMDTASTASGDEISLPIDKAKKQEFQTTNELEKTSNSNVPIEKLLYGVPLPFHPSMNEKSVEECTQLLFDYFTIMFEQESMEHKNANENHVHQLNCQPTVAWKSTNINNKHDISVATNNSEQIDDSKENCETYTSRSGRRVKKPHYFEPLENTCLMPDRENSPDSVEIIALTSKSSYQSSCNTPNSSTVSKSNQFDQVKSSYSSIVQLRRKDNENYELKPKVYGKSKKRTKNYNGNNGHSNNQHAAQEATKETDPPVACPICNQDFSPNKIEEHAERCTNYSDNGE